MPQKRLQVAMLEDDSDDRYLTTEIIEDLGFDLQINFFTNSNDLLIAVGSNVPHMILVDYNSTPENGLEILRKLKSMENAKSIPVVILSDSHTPKYRKQCYSEGAAAFIIKPGSLEQTKQKIKTFFTYWMEVAEL